MILKILRCAGHNNNNKSNREDSKYAIRAEGWARQQQTALKKDTVYVSTSVGIMIY